MTDFQGSTVTGPVNLWEEQRRIEEEATLTGIRRAARALEKAKEGEREATSQVGAAMVKRIVSPMAEMLTADLDNRRKGKATKGGPSLQCLKDLDPTLASTAATRAALNRMSRPVRLTALARRIGEALEDELIWRRWERLNKGQASAVRRRVNQSNSAHQRRAALRGFAKAWEKRALSEAWSSYRLIGVGLRFVDYLVKLKVFIIDRDKKRKAGKQPPYIVRLAPDAANWAKEMADFIAVSRPLAWPLVIPPVPWTTTQGGGFHFREGMDHPLIPRPLKPLPLVRRACKEQKEMLAKADLSVVYEGINAAQSTAWRINPKVYAVLVKLMEIGHDAPGLTALDPKPEPGRLPDAEAKDAEKLRLHKNEIRKAKTANAKMISKRFAQHRIFSAARKFVPYKELYFAYNLDFRGRVYACSDDLSPQGNDLQRGLLEFAEGDTLNEDGADWLLIHLANTYGVDKVSFAARLRWAVDHHAMLLEVAANPLDCTAWHTADQPWQFLAACFAYEDFVEKRFESVCRVPVMLDGSCSGIQHYAALLRDEVAGAQVNLIPSDKPGDLYNVVAGVVNEECSPEWKAFGITRKEVKRSVMVLPYGGTFISNLDYVRDSVRKRLEQEPRPRWLTEETEQDHFVSLAKTNWAAMHEVVKGPITGMKWVRSLVRQWAKHSPRRKLNWVAPCGFPVVTDYLKRSVHASSVHATIGGEALAVRYVDATDVTDWERVERAAAPNFVHSLDASHLLLSLKRAKRAGIDKLAVVHDAFGTTPTRTAEFARILREEFAALYIWSPFECLTKAAREATVEVPELPPMGSLKTEDIAKSEYLFA